MWYQRSRGLRLLKYFLDVVYAGLYVGYSMRGRAWTKPLEWPVNLGALMYYAMQPKLAGEAAAAFFADKETDVLFVKRVWNLLDHRTCCHLPSVRVAHCKAPQLSAERSRACSHHHSVSINQSPSRAFVATSGLGLRWTWSC